MSTDERGPVLAVETGGTKIVARIVGRGVDVSGRWPTTTPEQAQADILGFVSNHLPSDHRIAGLGVASFGPIQLAGPDRGKMLATPKPHWTGSNLSAALADALSCPFAVETDVNAAALAEHRFATEVSTLAYVTVGTGIGGGLSVGGRTLGGALHPEIGHLTLERHLRDDAPSLCPFHKQCAEGLVSGLAVRRRLDGFELDQRPDVQEIAAFYLGQLLAALVLAWTPHRIVLGGGVGQAAGMLDAVRRALTETIGSYGVGDAVHRPDFLSAPRLSDSGLEGALIIGRQSGEGLVDA